MWCVFTSTVTEQGVVGRGRLDEAFINASFRSTPGPPQLLKRRVTFLPTYLQYFKTELCIEYVDRY